MVRKKRKRSKAQIAADARRTGRPPKRPADRHSEIIGIRTTPCERKRLEAEAKRRGVSLSALLMSPWREGE
jgi:predicted HicB family RNase H-like nuclease